ncbi:unnamed protein product [Ectocarpus sp. 13 AM-2016]
MTTRITLSVSYPHQPLVPVPKYVMPVVRREVFLTIPFVSSELRAYGCVIPPCSLSCPHAPVISDAGPANRRRPQSPTTLSTTTATTVSLRPRDATTSRSTTTRSTAGGKPASSSTVALTTPRSTTTTSTTTMTPGSRFWSLSTQTSTTTVLSTASTASDLALAAETTISPTTRSTTSASTASTRTREATRLMFPTVAPRATSSKATPCQTQRSASWGRRETTTYSKTTSSPTSIPSSLRSPRTPNGPETASAAAALTAVKTSQRGLTTFLTADKAKGVKLRKGRERPQSVASRFSSIGARGMAEGRGSARPSKN